MHDTLRHKIQHDCGLSNDTKGQQTYKQSHLSAHATLCTKVVFALALCLPIL